MKCEVPFIAGSYQIKFYIIRLFAVIRPCSFTHVLSKMNVFSFSHKTLLDRGYEKQI